MQFNSSLVREKFTITDNNAKNPKEGVIALSNRMVINLESEKTGERETFVLRGQNMHSCIRFAAMLVRDFTEQGSIMDRAKEYRWEDTWRNVVKGYEEDWNPYIWGAAYFHGRCIFEKGAHHPFLDIIEKCDYVEERKYEDSIAFAEEAFRQAGKDVKIQYDSNVAYIIACADFEAKSGIILRTANKTTTFNFTARPFRMNLEIKPSQTLTVSAAFLEGIQLAYQVGLYNKKLDFELIEKNSEDDKKGKRQTERIAALNRAISSYTHTHNVLFRPDRPVFNDIIREAEEAAREILKPKIQEMIDEGLLDDEDWIV